MFATQSFIHLDESFYEGQAVPLDHPIIALRPDLFTATPPNTTKTKKEA